MIFWIFCASRMYAHSTLLCAWIKDAWFSAAVMDFNTRCKCSRILPPQSVPRGCEFPFGEVTELGGNAFSSLHLRTVFEIVDQILGREQMPLRSDPFSSNLHSLIPHLSTFFDPIVRTRRTTSLSLPPLKDLRSIEVNTHFCFWAPL